MDVADYTSAEKGYGPYHRDVENVPEWTDASGEVHKGAFMSILDEAHLP